MNRSDIAQLLAELKQAFNERNAQHFNVLLARLRKHFDFDPNS